MDDKRPIDRKRDSGGAADIGSEADGAIIETFEYNDSLLIIKEKAIYEFSLADKVDPDRKNIDLPTTFQQLVLPRGAESELVCRTFLTAKRLLKEGHFQLQIDCKKALGLSLEAVKELVALDSEICAYLIEEKKVSQEYEDRKGKKLSYAVPSIPDVNTRCKTMFQKADHVTQILMELITLFYPNSGLTKQSHFPRFYDILKTQYGEDDSFSKFINDALPFLELVRSLRNCLDHRLTGVTVKDFELQANSDIITPTIELDFRGSKLNRESLNSFLSLVLSNLITIFELTLVQMTEKNVKADKVLPNYVKFIPEERRRNKHIRYSFWIPLGEGGFFDQ